VVHVKGNTHCCRLDGYVVYYLRTKITRESFSALFSDSSLETQYSGKWGRSEPPAEMLLKGNNI